MTTDRYRGFEMGPTDNPFTEPIVRRQFSGIIVGENDDSDPIEAALVQIRGKGTKGLIKEVRTGASGTFRLRALPVGEYFFVAVARGFQSVSGCLVIDRQSRNRSALVVRLPLGL